MIFPLVREMAAPGARIRVPVAVACRVLGFSTQAYYKWRAEPIGKRERDDAETINKLVDLHEDDPTLGYRFLADELEHTVSTGFARLAGSRLLTRARRARRANRGRRFTTTSWPSKTSTAGFATSSARPNRTRYG